MSMFDRISEIHVNFSENQTMKIIKKKPINLLPCENENEMTK